ncbi:hypothetical protein ABEB36_012835 [Hypothenemus hampei]|uniref:DUF4817 domain-containing protein n=1 Tax=Hypothenemus hampei TaxID=57062 RepID=A0ABD1E696_HYPHA
MYTAAEYTEMIILFGECGRNAREAARVYGERFPKRLRYPDHKTILHVLARSREIGALIPNRLEAGGASRVARALEVEEFILDTFEEWFLAKREYLELQFKEF